MTDTHLRVVIAVLALLGTTIAAYLTFTHYSGAPIACSTGGCETVQQSRYAELGGIPVAVLGLAAYLAVLATALSPEPTSAAVGAGIALAGLAFSAWLLYAQLALIDAICQWCVANDVIVSLLALVSLLRLRLAQAPQDSLRF